MKPLRILIAKWNEAFELTRYFPGRYYRLLERVQAAPPPSSGTVARTLSTRRWYPAISQTQGSGGFAYCPSEARKVVSQEPGSLLDARIF